jgi:ferredoxin
MMGIPQEKNPLLVEAKKRKLHPSCVEDVEVIGVPMEQLHLHDFKLPASFTKENKSVLGVFLKPLIKNSFTVDPRIIKSKCTACGTCKKACPRDAIVINKVAAIVKKKCIRCYCCHEMCQYDAVELHKSLLYKLINKS